MSLDLFFEQMALMLNGHRSAESVEGTLGPSPSGTARLGRYTTLVARQRRGALDSFFAPVRVAAETWQPCSYGPLRDRYLASHPPVHWYPVEAGRHFSDFLAARSEVPGELAELADFAWVRHQVMLAPRVSPTVMGDGCVVRHYRHGVARFSSEVEQHQLKEGRPEPAPETWLVYRNLLTGLVEVRAPSLASLVVLATLEQRRWPDALPEGLTELLVREEAQSLQALGLLPAQVSLP